MYLFLFLLLPLSFFANYFYEVKKSNNSSSLVVFIVGTLFGFVYITCNALFSFAESEIKYDFFYNVFYQFLNELFVPSLFCLLFVFIISKNKIIFSLTNLFPFIIAFFSVFLPFTVLSKNNDVNFFIIFYKPVLFLVLMFYLKFFINYIIDGCGFYFRKIIASVIFIIILFCPCFLESAFYMGFSSLWISCLLVLYASGCISLGFWKHK